MLFTLVPIATFCEHDNGLSDCIKTGNVLSACVTDSFLSTNFYDGLVVVRVQNYAPNFVTM